MASAGNNTGANGLRLGLAARLAFRELRGGLSGFYIFLACVALGTGAIAGFADDDRFDRI